eukprot:3658704-Pyramimonas_sp.AAC.1
MRDRFCRLRCHRAHGLPQAHHEDRVAEPVRDICLALRRRARGPVLSEPAPRAAAAGSGLGAG